MKKTNKILPDIKIAEAIIDNPFLVLLLERFNISLPVQDLNISDLCKSYGINETLFEAFVSMYNGNTSIPELKLNEHDALTIVHFLRVSHIYYSEQIYPEIKELINRMNQLNDHKEMKLVSVFFKDYFREVTDHLDYENEVFHPYVIQLASQINNNEPSNIRDEYSVKQYKARHDDIEEKLNDLRNLLIKYLPVNQDQTVRRKLLFLLSELEFDLKIHSDIEELILIPFTLRMEKKVKQTEQ